jgi:hypothetical protein
MGTTVTANEYRPLYAVGQWHAAAGALAGILTIGLAVWIARVEKRAWLRRLSWTAAAGVIAQCLLGLAPMPQPTALRVAHALIAQLLFSAVVAIAVFTSAAWQGAPEAVVLASVLPTLAKITPVLVLAQVSLGVAHRHGVIEVLPHIVGALIVVPFILIVSMNLIYRDEYEALRSAGTRLMVVASIQLFLGFALFTMGLLDVDPVVVIVTTLFHSGVSALTLVASVVMAALVWRTVRRGG